MKYTHFHPITGHGYNVHVTHGFDDYAVWGHGLCFATFSGPLDAPEVPPSGGTTAMAIRGSIAHAEQMRDHTTSPACRFRHCTCGGRGDTVHVRNA